VFPVQNGVNHRIRLRLVIHERRPFLELVKKGEEDGLVAAAAADERTVGTDHAMALHDDGDAVLTVLTIP
jgi:hypothetical protein